MNAGEVAPPEIVEQELFKIFGGYHGYMSAPFEVVQKQRLVLLARWQVEYEQNKETEEKIAAERRKAGLS